MANNIGDDYSDGNDCPPSAKSHRRFRADHQGDRGLPDNLANTKKVFIRGAPLRAILINTSNYGEKDWLIIEAP